MLVGMERSTHYRARIASLTRSRPDDDPDLVEARRLFAEARLVERVTSVVDSADPTPEQRRRLAELILGGKP